MGDAGSGAPDAAEKSEGVVNVTRGTGRERIRRIERAAAAVAAGLVLLAGSGCASNHRPPMGAPQVEVEENAEYAFAVGVTPTTAPPVAVGAPVGFRLSSSRDGYAHLYLIGSDGGVTALAENLPVAAGAQADWPPPGGGVTMRASAPAGIDRLILLVTQQPFVGFVDATGPVGLAETAEAFLARFNAATARLPASSWAVAETRVQVVE